MDVLNAVTPPWENMKIWSFAVTGPAPAFAASDLSGGVVDSVHMSSRAAVLSRRTGRQPKAQTDNAKEWTVERPSTLCYEYQRIETDGDP
ncbi:hypothetical protein ACOMHN_028243 [Nucella lapillus]